MDLFDQRDWNVILQEIINLYKGRKLPLNYTNNYELMLMVLLAAQDSDSNINQISISFFKKFPTFESITKSKKAELEFYLKDVKNFKNKSKWIFEIAKQLDSIHNIPLNMKNLTQLRGIGRKSANVILRENHIKPEGIIVDLHVLRVSSRLGITSKSKDANKVEQQLMQQLSFKLWNETGMALSFLGREICRPNNPKCSVCILQKHCDFKHITS